MLIEASGSSVSGSSANCVDIHQSSRPSWNNNKDHDFSRLRAWNQNLFQRVQEVSEGLINLHLYNVADDVDVGILEGEVSGAVTQLSQFLRELREVRKQTALLERE